MEYSKTHSLSRSLNKVGGGTCAFWAHKPENKAIIFIHGFNGGAEKTWSNFPFFINSYSEFKGYDVFFYGYDSLFRQANNSGIHFFRFIESLHNNPELYQDHDIKEERKEIVTRYDKTVIVCHSLGAIVTRIALLRAHKKSSKWVKNTRMVLFAPAHMGARILPLVTTLLFPPVLSFVGFAAQLFIVTLDDLKEGSATLKRLTKETETIQQDGGGEFTRALAVIYADNERIVINEKFCDDPEGDDIVYTTHTTVCSPREKFEQPVIELIRYL
jgi:pimeloyl-ACP methyl ester carboxylesterase